MPGALEAIARLNHAGWHTVVATNQSGLGARPVRHGVAERHPRQDEPRAGRASAGASTRSSSARTAPTTAARCRKPLPGLFATIGERYGVDLRETLRWSATRCATCRPASPPAARRTWCAPARAPRSTRRALRAVVKRSAARTRARRPRRLRAAADPARAPAARRRRRGRFGLREAALMARALAVVRSALFVLFLAVTVVPWAIVGAGLFDLRPRRARCTGSAPAGCALAIWARARDLRRARPRARAARTCPSSAGRSCCPSTSRPGRPSPSRR